jgi:hypothetical protein
MHVTPGFRNDSGRATNVLSMTTSSRSPRTGKPAETRRESLLTDFALSPMSADERRRAAIAVCDRAASTEEARELLEALGLLDASILRGAA